MAVYIPFALQADIMKRLPTKSLMRFRSVSKPWKSLIDSPKFIADFSNNTQRLLVSYLKRGNHEQKYASCDDTFPLKKVSLPNPIPGLILPRILGSSKGLFCLYNISRERILKTVHLWNPSIRKAVAIDVSHVVVPYSHVVIGFGLCPHTGDPKLVKINSSYGFSEMDIYTPWEVEVYTLSSRSWRSIHTINQPRKSVCLLPNQVVINECIYWLANFYTRGCDLIVSFDLESEGFMEISLPDALSHAYNDNLFISKLKESLVVVEVVNEAGKRVYGLWTMEHGVSNTFVNLFSINSPDASIQGLLGFWKNNEPIFAMRTDDDDVDDVLVHELHSKHISFIEISGNGFSYSACSYTETLLLLDH